MSVGNYSFEASIIENGKPVKGTLTLFIDEYSFGSKRQSLDWEKTICERGTVSIKGFLRSTVKPCICFKTNNTASPQFVLEQAQMNGVLDTIQVFVESKRKAREEKEAKERADAEERQRHIDEENRIREEAKRKADEEYRQKQEAARQKKLEEERRAVEEAERKISEKKRRIQKEIEAIRGQNIQDDLVRLTPLVQKAGRFFLDNPYRILGVSCLATNDEVNNALDKLKKLARLKVLSSYQSPFDLFGLEKPVRDLSVAQNALVLLKDKIHKWFWFAEPDACIAWMSGRYRIELAKDGQEYGTYDLFLANYLYAVICDPNFNSPETWKRILNFYVFICKQSSCELLKSRYTEKELQNVNSTDLLNSFRNFIFKPILLLCERDDLDAILRLHKCIKECSSRYLDTLSRNVLGKLVSWFTDKEAVIMKYLREADEDTISDEKGKEIRERGEEYCRVVEPVLEMVLRDFRGDTVRYDMIKESYRTATYQLMYVLNKCTNKSDAIHFANKCYSYCNADDKKRIQNTFGKVNIKAIDWNTPHTVWNAKGDDFYYGRSGSVDYTQALYWYHKAADAGNMYAMNSIAICYQQGKGVPHDDKLYIEWLKKASNAGNPEGAYNLAECYFSGNGVKKDTDKALEYWSEAAKLGHPSAQQRRDAVFAKVQVMRRNHRTKNHICHDLGFQMTTGPTMVVEITLNQAANAYLVNAQGYQNYLNGNNFSYQGGYATQSPYRIKIPSSNHWYVIVDNGDDPISGVVSSAKVKRA